MSARRKHKRPRHGDETARARIESLAHDGRGVARIDGKAVFVDGALPGEEVLFRYQSRHRKYDEGQVTQILQASPQRVQPRCLHYGVCGGCALQHMAAERQIEFKQNLLLDNLRRIGNVAPQAELPPLVGPYWGYRRRARLSVRYARKKGRVLVGFREQRSPLITELQRCEVLHPTVGVQLVVLADLIQGLQARDRIAQIEVAVTDSATALVFRNLSDLSVDDECALVDFARRHKFQVYLQPGGPDSVTALYPLDAGLSYRLDAHDIALDFGPTDFIQINAEINQKMIERAIHLLALDGTQQVLDLFCGLGNFSLPLARRAAQVTGVEGSAVLVQRARQNAERNRIANAAFHAVNLAGDVSMYPWARGHFDRVLLDPPRAGALEVLPWLAAWSPERIVYVSCHPGTLARDAGELVHRHGFDLLQVGVMDMFPHTAHVESIAVFGRR